MVDFHKGYAENFSADDFENAAQRLLGDRYLELKALNATPAQICNEFDKYYFGGLVTEAPDNFDDITLLLSVSADFFAGLREPRFTDSEPEVSTKEKLSLAQLLASDIAPDRR
tara:strand:- start:1387 stop:1725 length:339 start_codon:yes stop_codon:yes gene_type:complete